MADYKSKFGQLWVLFEKKDEAISKLESDLKQTKSQLTQQSSDHEQVVSNFESQIYKLQEELKDNQWKADQDKWAHEIEIDNMKSQMSKSQWDTEIYEN